MSQKRLTQELLKALPMAKRRKKPLRVQRRARRKARYAPVSGELKFHDVDLDDAVISQTGTVTGSINLIAQGVTESQRIGRKCVIRSINWRFFMNLPEVAAAASPPQPDNVRVILFQDKQCNGAAATVTGILESADWQSFNNLANKSRFRILMDRGYDLTYQSAIGVSASSDWPAQVTSDTLFKTCNIPLEFDSTAGALTEIRSNNIGVLLMSQNGVSGFGSKFRLRFSDN